MNKQPTITYQSFLLRCWRPEEAQSGWRFALCTVAAEPLEVSFGTLDELIGFISAEFPNKQPKEGNLTVTKLDSK